MKRRILLICCLLAVSLFSTVAFVGCKSDKLNYREPTAEELDILYDNVKYDFDEFVTATSTGNYTRTTTSFYGDATTYIKWTATVITEEANASDVTISEPVNDIVTVKINTRSTIDFYYTLSFTLVDINGNAYTQADGTTYTYSRELFVPKYEITSFSEFISIADENVSLSDSEKKTAKVKGYIVGIITITSGSKGSIYFVDDDGNGFYAYKPKNVETSSFQSDDELRAAYPAGTEIIVSGTPTIYGGQYEFNSGCNVELTGDCITADELDAKYRNATEAWGKASGNTDTALVPWQNSMVVLNNCKLVGISDNYYYFTVNGIKYNVYKTNYFMDGDAVAEMLATNYIVGKQATVKGLVSCYSKEYQIYPLGNDCLTDIADATFTSAEKFDSTLSEFDITTDYTANGEQALPSAGTAFTDVSIAWSFEGDAPACATIADNKLTVTIGETSEQFTLVATLTCGDDTYTEKYTVKTIVSNSFIAQALKAAASLAVGSFTENSYMLIGTVEITAAYDSSYKNVSFNLNDGTQSILVFRYNLDDASTVKNGDTLAITAKIKNYNGTIEAVSTFTKLDLTSIADAKAAGLASTGVEGTKVYGKISEINSAYNTQFKNITVTVTDGTDSIQCYRLSGGSDLSVGDYILVTGTPSAYNSTAQFAAGATYVKTSEVISAEKTDEEKLDEIIAKINTTITTSITLDGTATWTVKEGTAIVIAEDGTVTVTQPEVGESDATVVLTAKIGDATKDVTITVQAKKDSSIGGDETPSSDVTTIADALEASEGTKASFSGTVSGIYQAWSTEFGNMSVYVSDGTNRIIVFRTTTQVGIGDIVSVSGTITIYNETAQISQGNTVTITQKHVCSTFTEATCLDASKCTVCGEEHSAALGHTEANAEGKCDRCGIDLETASKYVTVTAKYSAGTTTNMTGGNDAAKLGLDATIFSAVSEKTNNGNNHVGLNRDGTIRLYKKTTATLTISVAAGYEIVSIKFELGGTVGTLTVAVDGSVVAADNGVYTIGGSSVSIYNTNTSSQTYVKSIEITYAPVTAE